MSPRKRSSLSSRSPSEVGREIGLYLHLPFCVRKCCYCDFDSAPLEAAGGLAAARRYVEALCIELDRRAASTEFHGGRVATIYLGGGTPTVLPTEWLAEVLGRVRHRFPLAPEAEITVEANPGTVDEGKVAALLAAGANRLSLGAQSFSDQVLRTLGRAHDANQSLAAIRAARAAGCRNLGLDLIYGVPGQSLEEWQGSLRQALEARPEHISAYGLSVEPGTALARVMAAGELAEVGEDLYARMYAMAAKTLVAAGYRHYEISNFALPGYECCHNRRYWAGAEYLGLGCSAHSYNGGVRWNNLAGAGVYTEWLDRGLLPVQRAEALSPPRRLAELLMLGLRLAEGVSEKGLAARTGLRFGEVFGQEIASLCEQRMLVKSGDRLRIPRARWIVSNEVLSYLAG